MQEVLIYIEYERKQFGTMPERASISAFRGWSGVTKYTVDISFNGRTYRTCTFVSEEEAKILATTLSLQYGTQIVSFSDQEGRI